MFIYIEREIERERDRLADLPRRFCGLYSFGYLLLITIMIMIMLLMIRRRRRIAIVIKVIDLPAEVLWTVQLRLPPPAAHSPGDAGRCRGPLGGPEQLRTLRCSLENPRHLMQKAPKPRITYKESTLLHK